MDTEENVNSWYALKVFYNKVFRLEEKLKELGVECYVPTETVVVEQGGVKTKKRRAVIPSLMFVNTTEDRLAEVENVNGISVYVYKRTLSDGKRIPAVIPKHEMDMFILVSSSGELGLEFFDAEKLNLNVGNRVRVIDGIFKGSEGYIKRIKGNRRFVVSINGVCAVATPYIPVAFLQKIEN